MPRRIPEVLETGTEGAYFDWSVGPGVVDRIARDTPVERPVIAAGDAVLFDDLFLHRTGVPERVTTERHAIEAWFFAPSCYPADNYPLVY